MNLEKIIELYFSNPILTKIKNDQGFSFYTCKIQSLLINSNRYLVAITNRDAYLIGQALALSDIRWISLQTRVLNQAEKTSEHVYTPRQSNLFNIQITQKERDNNVVLYNIRSYPNYELSLLENQANLFEYPVSGTLNSALETYHCVIRKL